MKTNIGHKFLNLINHNFLTHQKIPKPLKKIQKSWVLVAAEIEIQPKLPIIGEFFNEPPITMDIILETEPNVHLIINA